MRESLAIPQLAFEVGESLSHLVMIWMLPWLISSFFVGVMCHLGLIIPTASLVSDPNDAVVQEALACLVSVMDGGLPLAQEAFKKHFSESRIETFFDDVKERLKRFVASLTEVGIPISEQAPSDISTP